MPYLFHALTITLLSLNVNSETPNENATMGVYQNQPEEDAGKPDVDSETPVVDTEKPVVDTEEPVVDTDEPVVDTDEPDVDTDEPDVDTDEPDVDTDEPDVDTDEPVLDTEEPDVDTEKPDVDTEEPDVDTEEPQRSKYHSIRKTMRTSSTSDENTQVEQSLFEEGENTSIFLNGTHMDGFMADFFSKPLFS